MNTEIPCLVSDRLRMRGHKQSDLADCIAMWADPIVTRYIGGEPSPEHRTWTRLLTYIGHWSVMGFGYWVVEEKITEKFVGEVGFADFRRDIRPSLNGRPELGWALASWAHGKGFATEAVRAAIEWGDTNLGAKETICIINPDNLTSIRVAEKCGYQELQRTTYNGIPTTMYSRQAMTQPELQGCGMTGKMWSKPASNKV